MYIFKKMAKTENIFRKDFRKIGEIGGDSLFAHGTHIHISLLYTLYAHTIRIHAYIRRINPDHTHTCIHTQDQSRQWLEFKEVAYYHPENSGRDNLYLDGAQLSMHTLHKAEDSVVEYQNAVCMYVCMCAQSR